MITAGKLKHQRISRVRAEREWEREERDFSSINLVAVWACVCREVFTKWYTDGALSLSTLSRAEGLLNPRSISGVVLTSIWATHCALFQCLSHTQWQNAITGYIVECTVKVFGCILAGSINVSSTLLSRLKPNLTKLQFAVKKFYTRQDVNNMSGPVF